MLNFSSVVMLEVQMLRTLHFHRNIFEIEKSIEIIKSPKMFILIMNSDSNAKTGTLHKYLCVLGFYSQF